MIENMDKISIIGGPGTGKSSLAKNSDVIIFLDYSKKARLKGILSRYFEWRGDVRDEIPGCKERMISKVLL